MRSRRRWRPGPRLLPSGRRHDGVLVLHLRVLLLFVVALELVVGHEAAPGGAAAPTSMPVHDGHVLHHVVAEDELRPGLHHGDTEVFRHVVADDLDRGRDERDEAAEEGEPVAELRHGEVDVEAVGVDLLVAEDGVVAGGVGAVLEALRDLGAPLKGAGAEKKICND